MPDPTVSDGYKHQRERIHRKLSVDQMFARLHPRGLSDFAIRADNQWEGNEFGPESFAGKSGKWLADDWGPTARRRRLIRRFDEIVGEFAICD